MIGETINSGFPPQMALEKEASEREKWEILKKAREAAERAVALRAELDHKEALTRQLETDLGEVSKVSSNNNPTPQVVVVKIEIMTSALR